MISRALKWTILAGIAGASSVASAGAPPAGLTLLEPVSARAEGVGGAFTAASDDVTAFSYNPASLRSLSAGQASFLFQRGWESDGFGHIAVGVPAGRMALGLSAGFYETGVLTVDDGVRERSVRGQRDAVVRGGTAFRWGPADVGLALSYLTSQIAEEASATAVAGDAGLALSAGPRWRFGGAVQNIGAPMTYLSLPHDLPRLARAGLAWRPRGNDDLTVFADGEKMFSESVLRPSAGVESRIGPLAVRGGYERRAGDNVFSLGAGFALGAFTLDYAFGLIANASAAQRLSLVTKFGGTHSPAFAARPPTSPVAAAAAPAAPLSPTASAPTAAAPTVALEYREPVIVPVEVPLDSGGGVLPKSRVYEVKDGETLRSIARKEYGREDYWAELYRMNRWTVSDPSALAAGQKILLPAARQ